MDYINNGDCTSLCIKCNKIYKTKGIHVHMWKVHGDGIHSKPFKGKTPWNKGKTKDSDDRVRIACIKIKSSLTNIGSINRLLNKAQLDDYTRYKNDCSFRFSLNDYQSKFDFELIKKYGWYKAKNRGDNPHGISRDHIISVKYGWLNNISPSIISHPANCQLLQQSLNSKKKTDNWLTLDELMIRIKQWDSDTLPITHTSSDELTKLAKKPKIQYYKQSQCIICNNACCNRTKTHICKECDLNNRIDKRIVERPSKDTMIELLKSNSILSISKQYKVSDNSIRKWLLSYGIPTKRIDIKKYIQREALVSHLTINV